ncbi:MAG: formyltransferase [Elusimicrobiales bacterium]|nr:formyltransferase [Elusimicrobiales bacterium]
MRAVVFAYQEIGCVCLEELLRRGVSVAALITHADDPGEEIWFRSAAAIAREHEIPVYETDEVKGPDWKTIVESYKPDAIFSFMFRRMIAMEILSCAKKGAFNLHPSYLPKYRGRCPANWALVNGEPHTGVTLHEMARRADAGAIVAQAKIPMAPDDDIAALYKKMAAAAPALLASVLPAIEAGNYPRTAQDDSQATKFGVRRPDDGKFGWDWPAQKIHNLVRAVAHPYPGAFCDTGAGKLFVWKTANPRKLDGGAPGTIISLNPLAVAAGNGTALDLLRLQHEGEMELSAAGFVSGNRLDKNSKITDRRKS